MQARDLGRAIFGGERVVDHRGGRGESRTIFGAVGAGLYGVERKGEGRLEVGPRKAWAKIHRSVERGRGENVSSSRRALASHCVLLVLIQLAQMSQSLVSGHLTIRIYSTRLST